MQISHVGVNIKHYYAASVQFEALGPNGANVPKCLLESSFNSP